MLADLMWQAGGLEESPSMHQGKWDPFVEKKTLALEASASIFRLRT
jgi:hypothetical protein